MKPYLLALAHPDYAAHYRRDTLTAADQTRLTRHPALETRGQWQTSRALLAQLRRQYPELSPCLSHKHDHSAVALGVQKPGVDLEQLRTRDIHAIAAHSFSAQECETLRTSAEPILHFYQLWTLKEALIKLENLQFPKHLRATGLRDGAIYSPSGTAYRWSSLLLDERWLLSGVWHEQGDHALHLHLHAPQPMAVRTLAGNLPDAHVHHHPLV